MSEEIQAMGTVINVAFEGYSVAFKTVGTLGAKTAQAVAKALMCMFKASYKGVKNYNLKKLEKMVGEVDLETLWKKDGTNLEYFAIKDSEYAQFVKMCEKEGISICKMPDFNKEDGLTYIQVGANNVRAVQFNIDVLTKNALDKGKIKEGENVGQQCTIEDWIKSAPGRNDDEKINNFISMSNEMYAKQHIANKEKKELPSKSIPRLEAKQEEAIIASVHKSDNKIYAPNKYESFRVSKTAIVDENKKSIKIQCSADEFMVVNKELVSNIGDKDIVINAPKDVNHNHGIVLVNSKNYEAEIILNNVGVKQALDGRAEEIKKRTANVVSRMKKNSRSAAKNIPAPKVVKG